MFSTDLARIRQQVREGALQRLGVKPGRKVALVSSESYDKLKAELQEKERALADQAVELAILRKKTRRKASFAPNMTSIRAGLYIVRFDGTKRASQLRLHAIA
jgi:hypothetical protein